MNRDEMSLMNSYDWSLLQRVYGFGELFLEMVFDEDSETAEFRAGMEEFPDELEYFDYDLFHYQAGVNLGNDTTGQFEPATQTLRVADAVPEDSVILHEMIHLHEYVLNQLSSYFREIVLYVLYRKLSGKISDLDARILSFGHIGQETLLQEQGSTHGLLFLLKSFDLDLRMGYPLGTVFGYGMADA